MDTKTLWILLLTGIGVLNTLYLSWHAITKKPVKCIGFPNEWCRKVQYSSYSKTFGIPNPFAGLAMYVGILLITWYSLSGGISFDWARYLIYIGFAFSMYFTAVQLIVLRAFCTWCVLSAIDFIVLFLLII